MWGWWLPHRIGRHGSVRHEDILSWQTAARRRCPAPEAAEAGPRPVVAVLRLAVPHRVVSSERVCVPGCDGRALSAGPELGRPSAAVGLTMSCPGGGHANRDHFSSTRD